MSLISDQIRGNVANGFSPEYHLYFVPRKTTICERILEENGVIGDIQIGEFHLDFVPLEEDLLSLEFNDSFKELYLEKDSSCLHNVSKALMKLQVVFGLVPKILGKGEQAKALVDLMLRMHREFQVKGSSNSNLKTFPRLSQLDSLIILDRTLDLVTPVCTQLTYEGLLDEVFGLKTSFVEVNPSFLSSTTSKPITGSKVELNSSESSTISSSSPPSATRTSPLPLSNKSIKVQLNSTDSLHSQIRDMNFAMVGKLLSSEARKIQNEYESRHQAKTIGQIRDFMGKLGVIQSEHQALRLHTNIAEEITKHTSDPEFDIALEIQQNFVAGNITQTYLDQIENMIAKQVPFHQVLRLLCLYSLVNGGVKSKLYDSLRRDILLTYGHEHILTFQDLAKCGLFQKQIPKNKYPPIRKAFQLIVDDVNELEPNDISYVYSGYAPLTVRLIQIATLGRIQLEQPTIPSHPINPSKETSWKNWNPFLELIPGPTIEVTQNTQVVDSESNEESKTTLLLFLGGITYSEVSAIRFLHQLDPSRKFVILTTHMMNGNSLLSGLIPQVNK